MLQRSAVLAALSVALLLVIGMGVSPAGAADPDDMLPDLPAPILGGGGALLPGGSGMVDCKESPTPDTPGRGIAGFFSSSPDQPPKTEDPFAKGATTTIYEQYGYAGLRYRTYDLGCGPDTMRQPDAVIGTAVANWIMQAPLAFVAFTGSVTELSFEPTFLQAFDPSIERVSSALHQGVFGPWIPVVLVLLGLIILFKSKRQNLASTAGGIGWAMLVVILATALFRWPVEAGHAVDGTVTGVLGQTVEKLDGREQDVDPGTAVASHVQESLLYRAWLAGTLGSPDSETAKKYGPELFKAQALTWEEVERVQSDPEWGKEFLQMKRDRWEEIAGKIQAEDPEAYEYLTGERSETRVGYAMLSGLGAFLALPFLLVSALMLLGSYLVVRIAVMMFPAFAVLGALPATRGLVLGLGRTVGAAVVNAVLFGIGAAVTIAVLAILFHPGAGTPPWLSLVLMPLFTFIMWVLLKPFRRLTSMVSRDEDLFGRGMESIGSAQFRGVRQGVRTVGTVVGAATGGAAGAAVADHILDEDRPPPQRAEARTYRPDPPLRPAVLAAPSARPRDDDLSTDSRTAASPAKGPSSPRNDGTTVPHARAERPFTGGGVESPALTGFRPRPSKQAYVPPPPAESEWLEGEEVYQVYRPTVDSEPDTD